MAEAQGHSESRCARPSASGHAAPSPRAGRGCRMHSGCRRVAEGPWHRKLCGADAAKSQVATLVSGTMHKRSPLLGNATSPRKVGGRGPKPPASGRHPGSPSPARIPNVQSAGASALHPCRARSHHLPPEPPSTPLGISDVASRTVAQSVTLAASLQRAAGQHGDLAK